MHRRVLPKKYSYRFWCRDLWPTHLTKNKGETIVCVMLTMLQSITVKSEGREEKNRKSGLVIPQLTVKRDGLPETLFGVLAMAL